MAKPRTLLAHSDHAFLNRLARVLAPEFEIIGMLDDVRVVPGVLRMMRPELIVQNLSHSPEVGLTVIDTIRYISADICVVVVTHTLDEHVIENAFDRGVSAVILQSASDEEFLDAIRAAYARRE